MTTKFWLLHKVTVTNSNCWHRYHSLVVPLLLNCILFSLTLCIRQTTCTGTIFDHTYYNRIIKFRSANHQNADVSCSISNFSKLATSNHNSKLSANDTIAMSNNTVVLAVETTVKDWESIFKDNLLVNAQWGCWEAIKLTITKTMFRDNVVADESM